jgi:hypothetical protein
LTGLRDGFTEFVARCIVGIADRSFHRSVRGEDGDFNTCLSWGKPPGSGF